MPLPGVIVQLRKKPFARWTVHTATSMLTVRAAAADERERAGDSSRPPHELDDPDKEGQRIGRREPELREERGRARQAAAAPEAKQLLRAMRREDRPDCQPEDGRTKQRHVPSRRGVADPREAAYCVTLRRWKYSILALESRYRSAHVTTRRHSC